MLKFFRIPFALSGDKATIPDTVDAVLGSVSYPEGFGFNYQRDYATDPLALNVPRDQSNQLYFDITNALAELQAQGVPDFITSALNGGTAYSYAAWAIVRYSGDLYLSLEGSNTALPTDATKWALLPTPARLQSALNTQATAAGTVDALTAAFTPAIAALPSAPGTLSVLVRAGGANLTTTPTFKADGTAAKVIVKGANAALAIGDIAGAGHWLRLDYDATLDKWVLLNPAKGVSGATVPDASTTVKGIVELATDAETITGTDTDRAVTPHGLAAALATITGWPGVYTGSDANNLTFPVGACLFVVDIGYASHPRNSAQAIYLDAGANYMYTTASGGSMLAGTWRNRGGYSSDVIYERTA